MNQYLRSALLAWTSLMTVTGSRAYTVTDLQAAVQNGQVFLTWTNPPASNLQYNVYRSSEKFSSVTQLTQSSLLGFVRDFSGKNLRKSGLQGQAAYFIIKEGNAALEASQGLYTVTSTDNKRHYYAVMVVNLNTGVEEKVIHLGENSFSSGVKEHKGSPLPVLQDVVEQTNGDLHYEYAIWGNNQDVPGYAAFNNCGSFGYVFTLIRRNPGFIAPLYIKFDDDDPYKKVASDFCSDCNILMLDDWLPNEKNSYWVGFNTNYDMYDKTNPIQTSGRVRTYTQNRLREIIEWAGTQSGVDATRTYSSGFSHNGFGALFNAVMMPELIAAVDENAAPILIKAMAGSFRETQWCKSNYNLKSDVISPKTGDTLLIWDLLDIRTMLDQNYKRSLPYMNGINGKQDVTVGWVQKYHWYDSVAKSRHGGTWFWDQRNHTGSGKDFTPDEIKLPFSRFSTAASYPAFSYCSVDQDPGNGNPSEGDDFGAINGYLDWKDSSVSDQVCSYSIECFVKDFYIGGELQPVYDSCTADVTLRRLQKFKPVQGDKIDWSVSNSNGKKVQKGTLTYQEDEPLTLKNVKIYRKGSTLLFEIKNCQKEASAEQPVSGGLILTRLENGCKASVELSGAGSGKVEVFDLTGRIVFLKNIQFLAGYNQLVIPLQNGCFIVHLTTGKDTLTGRISY